MSLLMDALKKAELAKRQGRGDGASGPTATEAPKGLSLELIPDVSRIDPAATAPEPARPAAGKLPHLASHLEELDAQFLAEATQAASARSRTAPAEPLAAPEMPPRAAPPVRPRPAQAEPGAVAAGQSGAQNLFAAKQAPKPQSRKTFAIAIGIFTVLSVGAIGGYFWWQLQPKSSLVANSRTPVPPPATPAAGSQPVAAPSAPTVATPSMAPVAAAPSATRPATPTRDDQDDDVVQAAKATAQSRRASSPAAPAIEPEGPVRVTKAPLKVNPALSRGFDAFNRGDLVQAQTEYEKAQKSDPKNTDVLHGLAAIAVRQGRLDQAESIYRRIAEADPHDTVALSALINLRGQMDPGTAESRLKSLSADQPELAAPHFSLGNLYARHGRWSDAQQAYFRAYSAEPDNPDILYNLAISLEHLRQNKLAAQYYGQAIAAAQTRPAGFDKDQAAARLRSLQP